MSLLIDNSEKLKNLLEFNEGKSFYLFMALIRAKDYKNGDVKPVLTIKEKQEVLVKTWMVDSKESLSHLLPDMLKTTELFKCRLYVHTDRKSYVKSLLQLRNNVDKYLDCCLFNNNSPYSAKAYNKLLTSSASVAEASDKDARKWLYDVDTKDPNIVDYVFKHCEAKYVCFETKNGYHVIADRKYDAHKEYLPEEVELKDNAMALVAMANLAKEEGENISQKQLKKDVIQFMEEYGVAKTKIGRAIHNPMFVDRLLNAGQEAREETRRKFYEFMENYKKTYPKRK